MTLGLGTVLFVAFVRVGFAVVRRAPGPPPPWRAVAPAPSEIFVAIRPLSAGGAGNGAGKFQRRQTVAGAG